MDDANCFHMIRLELKTSVNDMNVTVVSTVTGCDVTTVQQHCKGSTSTPPRVARLCQIREASLVAQKISKKKKNPRLLTCVDRSTRPIHRYRIQRFPLSLVATVPFARWTRLAQLCIHAKH